MNTSTACTGIAIGIVQQLKKFVPIMLHKNDNALIIYYRREYLQ